jgi:hypothetical protein
MPDFDVPDSYMSDSDEIFEADILNILRETGDYRECGRNVRHYF